MTGSRSRRPLLAGGLLASLAVLTAVGLLVGRPGPPPRSSPAASATSGPGSSGTPSTPPAVSATTATYADGPFEASVTREPTGGSSQSKLWFNDGAWWAILREPTSQELRIARLDWPTQHWIDTGTLVDERLRVSSDVVWDGDHLLVATAGSRASESQALRLARFSYDASARRYDLDSDFPLTLTARGVAGPAIARDSGGLVWLTYLDGGVLVVRHTVAGDLDWTAPAALPVEGADGTARAVALASDGTRVAVVWSRVDEAVLRAAIHVDGTPAGTWVASATAVDGLRGAPGGFSARGVVRPDGPRLFVAFEVATDAATTNPQAPGAVVMVLEPDGSWTNVQLARAKDHMTDPILAIDDSAGILYAIAGATSIGQITYKATPLDRLGFESGTGNALVAAASDPTIRNPTTTRQMVDGRAGFVVLAADDSTGRYLHGALSTEVDLPVGGPPPPPMDPIANTLLHDTFDPWPVGVRAPAGWIASDEGGGAGRLSTIALKPSGRGLEIRTTSATGSLRACKSFAATDVGVLSVAVTVQLGRVGDSDATLLSLRGPGGEAVSVRVTRNGLVAYYAGQAKVTTRIAAAAARWYRLTATVRPKTRTYDWVLAPATGRAIGQAKGVRWRTADLPAVDRVCVQSPEGRGRAVIIDDIEVQR